LGSFVGEHEGEKDCTDFHSVQPLAAPMASTHFGNVALHTDESSLVENGSIFVDVTIAVMMEVSWHKNDKKRPEGEECMWTRSISLR